MTNELRSARKPYNNNPGYVGSLKAVLGGHIVIYDSQGPNGLEIDADHRWVVMHEPSSQHVSVPSLLHARAIMKGVARAATKAEAMTYADILPK